MKRDERIDFLKGISMLLVVMGHAMSHFDSLFIPYNIIYSFHMPLLFFLSGYINEKKRISEDVRKFSIFRYLQGKTISLIFPYVAWNLIDIFIVKQMRICLNEVVYRVLGINGASALWFLPVLFGITVVYGIDVYVRNLLTETASLMLLSGMYIVLIGLSFFTKYTYAINMLSYFIPFYFGVFVLRYRFVSKYMYSKIILWICVATYLALLTVFDFRNTSWIIQLIRIIMGISMSVILNNLTNKISLGSIIDKGAIFFGKYSLAIYVLHNYCNIWYRLVENNSNVYVSFLLVLGCSAVVCAICALTGMVLGKIPIVNMVLMGRKGK